MTLRDKYKKYLGQVAPLALQAQLQNPPGMLGCDLACM
jgi:hypothetical protein